MGNDFSQEFTFVILRSGPARIIQKVAASFLIALAAGSLVAMWASTPSYATQAQPPLDYNYYVRTINSSTLYSLGYQAGWNDWYFHNKALIILDFGAQTTDGSTSIETVVGTPLSNFQIRELAQEFALGYVRAGGFNLYLGIGTNNSRLPDQGTYGDYGTKWNTDVVTPVRSWISGQGYSGWVQVEGANDIESWQGQGGGTGAHPS